MDGLLRPEGELPDVHAGAAVLPDPADPAHRSSAPGGGATAEADGCVTNTSGFAGHDLRQPVVGTSAVRSVHARNVRPVRAEELRRLAPAVAEVHRHVRCRLGQTLFRITDGENRWYLAVRLSCAGARSVSATRDSTRAGDVDLLADRLFGFTQRANPL